MKRFDFIFLAIIAIVLHTHIHPTICTKENDYNEKTILNPKLNIMGSILKTNQGKNFYAFRGIPYAKPPILEKRFKDPEPYGNWTNILDATKDGSICTQSIRQSNKYKNDMIISEDCLNLNIYTRTLEGNRSVLVYIHGGGYKYGTGNSHKHNPKYLLDNDIVLITFNYRLGPFGFLSTGTIDATGNYGFKDQILVLKWIQMNIEYFGGNKNSITLIGHSVGAMSATLHMISPMSRNLFHKIIAISGSAISHWNINNIYWTQNLTHTINCPINDTTAMIDCLRTKPWEDIIEICQNWEEFNLADLKWNYEIEKDYGQERFIIEDPLITFKNGDFYKVPVIIGITNDEFANQGNRLLSNTELLNNINENFNYYAPIIFGYNDNKNSNAISNALKEFYFNNNKIGILNELELGNLFSDSLINHGVHRFVQLASKYIDIYYYKFNYKGRYTCSLYNSYGEPYYVYHSDILIYLFNEKCSPELHDEDEEYLMVKRINKYFINFANYDNPNENVSNNNNDKLEWLPFKEDNLKILNIDVNCSLSNSPFENRFTFWDKLFPIE